MKTMKIFLILGLIFLLLGSSSCYAINLNIVDNSIETTNDSNNEIVEEDSPNAISNESAFSPDEQEDNSMDSSSEVVVNDINSASNTGLQLSDVLNILLIVIGTLLILLSIAIFIRLKK